MLSGAGWHPASRHNDTALVNDAPRRRSMPYTRRAILGLLLGSLGMVRGSSGGMVSSSSGATLSLAASLGENEWKVMREHVFPPFEAREHCRIRAVNIEAADTLKKLEVMHRANRMSIDVVLLYNMNLAPFV
jgi:trehalose transport system substrate-binding protein